MKGEANGGGVGEEDDASSPGRGGVAAAPVTLVLHRLSCRRERICRSRVIAMDRLRDAVRLFSTCASRYFIPLATVASA